MTVDEHQPVVISHHNHDTVTVAAAGQDVLLPSVIGFNADPPGPQRSRTTLTNDSGFSDDVQCVDLRYSTYNVDAYHSVLSASETNDGSDYKLTTDNDESLKKCKTENYHCHLSPP